MNLASLGTGFSNVCDFEKYLYWKFKNIFERSEAGLLSLPVWGPTFSTYEIFKNDNLGILKIVILKH